MDHGSHFSAILVFVVGLSRIISLLAQKLPPPPEDCPVLDVLPVAYYSGPLPCSLPGKPSTSNAAPCVNVTGKVALITGASTGIGRAVAERLAAAGMEVVGTSRWPWRYKEPSDFKLWQMDQTNPDSVTALIERVEVVYGRIDFLFMNAGRQFLGDIANSDIGAMELTLQTNFWGAIRVLQAALPLLPEKGYARVLQCSSIQSQAPSPDFIAYAASKFALQALQESWVVSTLGRTNIKYMSLLPGRVSTNLPNNVIFGCPELATSSAFQSFRDTFQPGPLSLEAKHVGEAVYRYMVIHPEPGLRYRISADGSWKGELESVCRRLQQPMEKWFEEQTAQNEGGGFECPPRPRGNSNSGAGKLITSY